MNARQLLCKTNHNAIPPKGICNNCQWTRATPDDRLVMYRYGLSEKDFDNFVIKFFETFGLIDATEEQIRELLADFWIFHVNVIDSGGGT